MHLASILPDKAAMIVYWAEVFGFTNVRICCDPNIEAFRILVSFDKNKKEHFSAALEGLLTDKLGCNTAVLIESRLKDLYVDFTLKQSVGLTELEKMKQLYEVDPLEEVSFEEIPSEKDELLYDLYVRSKRLAERILKEKNIPYNSNNPSTFFQDDSTREKNPQQSNNKKSAGTKRPNDSTPEQIIEKPNKIISPPRG